MLAQQGGLPLNGKHIISCCKKVSAEINARHDIVVNILLNNIMVQRGLITHEQKWEDRKTVRTPRDEITVGTEHLRSDEWKQRAELLARSSSPTSCGSDTTLEETGGRWLST